MTQSREEQLREAFREWWDKQAGEDRTMYQRIQQAFYAGAAALSQPEPSGALRVEDWLTPEGVAEVLKEYAPKEAAKIGWQTIKQITDTLVMSSNQDVFQPVTPAAGVTAEQQLKSLNNTIMEMVSYRHKLRQVTEELLAIVDEHCFYDESFRGDEARECKRKAVAAAKEVLYNTALAAAKGGKG